MKTVKVILEPYFIIQFDKEECVELDRLGIARHVGAWSVQNIYDFVEGVSKTNASSALKEKLKLFMLRTNLEHARWNDRPDAPPIAP
jgi:hypothetical protein